MPVKITQRVVKGAKAKDKAYEIRDSSGLVLRVLPTGRKTYYVRYGQSGRHRLGRADVMTLERAEHLTRDKLNELNDHGNILKRDLRTGTLSGFIAHEYDPWLRANRRRNPDRTLADIKRNFDSLYAKRLSDITRTDLDRYVAEGRTASTSVRSLNNLRAVLRLALERGYLRDSPFRGWRKPKVEDNGVTRYLDADEETQLRKALVERDDKMRRERRAANEWRTERDYDLLPEWSERQFPDHLHPMVLISLNTGLRYGELASLEWSAVDLRARVLTVVGATSKGAKTRHIPLNGEAWDVLTRWKADRGNGLVFTNDSGSRIGTVKTAWLSLLEVAGIDNFRWHDLRHTFASKLVQRGVDLAVVRDLLGHGDFKLTLRYAHLDAKQKTDAVARL